MYYWSSNLSIALGTSTNKWSKKLSRLRRDNWYTFAIWHYDSAYSAFR